MSVFNAIYDHLSSITAITDIVDDRIFNGVKLDETLSHIGIDVEEDDEPYVSKPDDDIVPGRYSVSIDIVASTSGERDALSELVTDNIRRVKWDYLNYHIIGSKELRSANTSFSVSGNVDDMRYIASKEYDLLVEIE